MPEMKVKARWQNALQKISNLKWEKPITRATTYEIQFDAPGAVYFSKDTVTGRVVLEVSEPIQLKGVKIRFKGECSIHFTDQQRTMKTQKRLKMEAEMRSLLRARARADASNHWAIPNGGTKQQNGHIINGVDNLGYIADHEEVGLGRVGSLTNSASSTTSSRPNSADLWHLGPVQHYRAQETYFDCDFYIYGHKYQKDEKEMLPAGRHSFPFGFKLPPNLPPSFHSEKGFITYQAIAILDRPAAANIVTKTGFTIHTILDLNMDTNNTSSASATRSKNLCCFCCATGPITLCVRIPRRGYVPGEKIIVNAEADNVSSRNTRRTRLLLLQVITFYMPNGVKDFTEERVLQEIVRGITPPGETDFWENVALAVPAVVTPNVHIACRLMAVHYRLDMILELPRPLNDLRVSLPITIGSVPLRSTFSSFLPPSETTKSEGLPGIDYNNFPSYTFTECFFGRESLESQSERVIGFTENYGPQYNPTTIFAPMYITYTVGNKIEEGKDS